MALRETHRIACEGDDGRPYTVVVRRRVIVRNLLSGRHETLGTRHYSLDDGTDVNCDDDDPDAETVFTVVPYRGSEFTIRRI